MLLRRKVGYGVGRRCRLCVMRDGGGMCWEGGGGIIREVGGMCWVGGRWDVRGGRGREVGCAGGGRGIILKRYDRRQHT